MSPRAGVGFLPHQPQAGAAASAGGALALRRLIVPFLAVAAALALLWPQGVTRPRRAPATQPHAAQTLATASQAAADGGAPPPAAKEPARPAAPAEPPDRGPWLARLETGLDDLMAAHGGRWGLVYEELAPADGFPLRYAVRDQERFYAASTTKAPTVLCLYTQAAKGLLSLDERMAHLASDQWGGSGVMQFAELGGLYTLRALASYDLRYSDNVAQNMLMRRLGVQTVNDCLAWFGGKVADMSVNDTTPADMAAYLRAVLAFQAREPELGGEIVSMLASTVYRHRIPAGLPAEATVANKTGTWSDTNSDAAIVYLPENPYLLVIYIEGIPEEQADLAIVETSALVYGLALERTEP